MGRAVPIRRDRPVESVATLLDSPEIPRLVAELEGLRWTGRKGYPIRSLVGAWLAKHLYAIPAWSHTEEGARLAHDSWRKRDDGVTKLRHSRAAALPAQRRRPA